jgi:hypothetical protein
MARPGARSGVVALVAMCVMLSTPVVAFATTGTATDLHERVTLTAKGTTWTPRIVSYRHATTGTTVKFTIVNRDSHRHWFQFGKHRTKLLKKGASQIFFYNFTRPVDVKWRVGPGKAVSKTSSGKIVVVFPPHFH